MCGLVGVFDLQQEAQRFRRSLQASVESLTHRGPDDSGEFFDGPVGLGFRRLSILDLTTSGHQPMTSSDGRWTVVYNGEIYNFRELRAELEVLRAGREGRGVQSHRHAAARAAAEVGFNYR